MADDAEGPLYDLIHRLERERQAADRAYNDALTAVDRAICDEPELSNHAIIEHIKAFESLLVQYLQTITAYVDTKDRAMGGNELRERLGLVEQRVAVLRKESRELGREAATPLSIARNASDRGIDSAAYVAFEDAFRGSPSDIRSRLEDYVPILASGSDIIDIGCGRGELLQLLKERGVTARGADLNPAMVQVCRTQGLDVEEADALTFLDRQADGSVGGLVAIQVVEHMEPPYLLRVLETAYHKMRPGAPLVLETINPACWMAFFETYLRDPTHAQPLHPDTLRHLVRATGFSSVDLRYRQAVRDVDRLDRVSEPAGDRSPAIAVLAAAINAHADKLNERLFSSMDYAIVARR